MPALKIRKIASLLLGWFLFSPFTLAQEIRVTLVDADNEPIAGAVVELVLPESISSDYASPQPMEIDQMDKEFVANVTTVVAGSRVSFPNNDDILHHVYSFSPSKTFNIPLYGREESDLYSETFDQPGVVDIGCNIHDWMLAYIYVSETELVAISDEQGVASIQQAPAGSYPLKVWHARLPASQSTLLQEVTIDPQQVTEIFLTLELERDRRVRRAPSANRKRYR